jgi:maleylacetoacetate isomerase/maleylpyruvate isomerase
VLEVQQLLVEMPRQQERAVAEFAFGDIPTIADCCLVPQVYSARRFELDLTPWPVLTGVADRAAMHPAFLAAHPNRQPDAKPL